MAILGLDPERDEAADVYAFFALISQSERERLYQFFHQQMLEEIKQRDWRDYESDGGLKAPGTKAAASGKS